MTWTDDRIEVLSKLWREGYSASQIATRLGWVTRNAVIGKVHRLGLAARQNPSQPSRRASKPARPVQSGVASAAGREMAPAAASARNLKAPPVARVSNPLGGRGVRKAPILIQVVEPAPDRPAIAEADMGRHMCRWPIGDPAQPGFGFCGASQAAGRVYCAEHAGIASRPLPPRRDAPSPTHQGKAPSTSMRWGRSGTFAE